MAANVRCFWRRNVSCDLLIGWRCSGDWQPRNLLCLSKREQETRPKTLRELICQSAREPRDRRRASINIDPVLAVLQALGAGGGGRGGPGGGSLKRARNHPPPPPRHHRLHHHRQRCHSLSTPTPRRHKSNKTKNRVSDLGAWTEGMDASTTSFY